MTEALNLSGPANLEVIHLDEPRERAYWAHVLSISEDQLEVIVGRVGPRAADVRHDVSRERHAEWRRKMHQARQDTQPLTQPSRGDPMFTLIVCCTAAAATTFGAFAYGLSTPDEWTAFQRQYRCEAIAQSNPKLEQRRCADGRMLVRTTLADAATGTSTKPAQ
jgi:hypothetical protein